MPDINKRQLGVRLKIELLRKIEKIAKKNKRTLFNQIGILLDEATRDVILDSSDYEAILKEVKKNEEKRNN